MAIKLPTLKADLPSNGFGYKEEDKILKSYTLNMMTLEDSKIMSSAGININKMITEILDRCIKEDVDSSKLYSADRLYLFFMLRKLSFGENYKLEYPCSNCAAKNTITMVIPEDFSVRLKESDKFEDTVTLPLAKVKVSLRLLTGAQEDKLYKKSVQSRDDMVIDRIAAHTSLIVDGEEKHTSYPVIKRLIAQLPFRDVRVLEKSISELEFGLTTTIQASCESCGSGEEVGVAIGHNFFRGDEG